MIIIIMPWEVSQFTYPGGVWLVQPLQPLIKPVNGSRLNSLKSSPSVLQKLQEPSLCKKKSQPSKLNRKEENTISYEPLLCISRFEYGIGGNIYPRHPESHSCAVWLPPTPLNSLPPLIRMPTSQGESEKEEKIGTSPFGRLM